MNEENEVFKGTGVAALAKDQREIGASMAVVRRPEDFGKPFVLVPESFKVQDLEHLLPNPIQSRFTIILRDVESFCSLLGTYQRADISRVFVDDANRALKADAVIDMDRCGSTDNEPGSWRRQRIVLDLSESEEFGAWRGANGKPFGQADFAEFLEDHERDVMTPESAQVRECVLGLEAKRDMTFRSGVRQDNGDVKFLFEEDTKATSNKGEMEMPTKIRLLIPIYRGGDVRGIDVRLVWRIVDGKLTFTPKVIALSVTLQRAQEAIIKQIECVVPGRVYFGTIA